jgi:multiple sugar transport system substrate-binding protein
MPDILHQHPDYINEYASRGTLLDLTPLVESGQIDLSNFPEGIIDSGKVGEGIFMITLGNSAPGVHVNTVMLEQAGVDVDLNTWSWDQFVDTAITVSDALGEDVWATSDNGGDAQAFEVFVNQHGMTLFGEDDLGFDRDLLIEWWTIWSTLREANATPPPEVSAEFAGVGHADSMLAKKMLAMQFLSGNQHKLFQDQIDDLLALSVIPRSNDAAAPGGDIIGGAYLSIAADTEFVDEAAAFVNWMINDPEVAQIYNAEHGPPGSTVMQEVVAPQLDEANQRLLDHMALVGGGASLRSQRPDWGNEAMDATFGLIWQEYQFGNYGSVEEAVDAFLEEVDFIKS